MKLVISSLVLMLLGGCAYTVFAPPAVLYSTHEAIGIKYRSSGVQSYDEPGKAMQLIAEHCSGRYEVTNRAENAGWTTVDAKCSK
ncbi:MAG: hypothetical protein ACRC9N_08560 [Aeromonas sp.]